MLLKGLAECSKLHAFGQSVKLSGLRKNSRHNISCAINMTAGQSDEPWKIKFDHLINKARKLWESSPQPVKIFPWKRAVQNFIQLILDLILAVVKYLSVPLLAVSSLSEMSYCAHAKKLFLVPIPVLIGMAIAEVLKLAALDASPLLKVKLFCSNPLLVAERFKQVQSWGWVSSGIWFFFVCYYHTFLHLPFVFVFCLFVFPPLELLHTLI